MKKNLFFFIFFSFLILEAAAQSKQLPGLGLNAPHGKIFDNVCHAIGAVYKCPVGFRELDTTERFMPGNRILLDSFVQELEGKKDDIMICFAVANYKLFNEVRIRKYSPNYSKNDEYKNRIKSKIDSSRYSFTPYKREFTHKVFNADTAGIYDFVPQDPYRNRYPLTKIVTIHKQDRADIEVFYFYNEKSKNRINKYIADTQGMIQFQD
ncbi:hypothetical protein [Mucilaginibacter lappiensis]|uniref:Uncharacterized protein n=1 Tax=Mucilaginibacter lappiensis TaxID=354630 RepID=A0A841JJC0_9SPHI|nr:hypothetical protein [Mucilaginibacter lappiensis]MBB6130584.1 hypothetical protein [Mucilaginibacter lappiensis]